ncbi:MAG: hypothetical protein ABIR81_03500 [Ginsengibacter sp.]
MNTKLFTFIASIFMALSSSAQDVKPQIQKAINSPSAKENSAKADVYFHKKAMLDSGNFINKTRKVNASKSKNKHCLKKKSNLI